MNLSGKIWLPANILFPDAPGSGTAELELRIRVPIPADPAVARKITLAELLAGAELLDYYAPRPPGAPLPRPPRRFFRLLRGGKPS